MPTARTPRGEPDARPIIGWREWVALPELGVLQVKAKVDTGARSSSLHAFDLEQYQRRGQTWVRFLVHPHQRSAEDEVAVEAKVHEFRSIRSSNGKASIRPVIVTPLMLLGLTWPVELTLASRDDMGFRMLLGREAVRRRFLVDPALSYRGGQPKTSRSGPRPRARAKT